MKIKDFIKTENGKRFTEVLSGCDKNWEVEYWKSDFEYVECLKDNGWNDEDIEEQLLAIDRIKLCDSASDYVLIIN